MEEQIFNTHNKEEFPPAHTAEHLLNQTMMRMFGCERSRNAHIERKKSKISYILDHKPDRKEEKDHGADKGSFLGSKLKDGDKVVMIEDVTTSGKSMEETVPKVRGAANVEIVGLMVSLNRMEKGLGGKVSALEEIKEKYGFDAHAIVTMQDVIDHLYNRPYKGEVYIDDTLKKAIDEYYAVYGA